MSNSPDQCSCKAAPFTVASHGADRSAGTNSLLHHPQASVNTPYAGNLPGEAIEVSPGLFLSAFSGSLAEVPSDAGQDNPGRNADVFPSPIRIIVHGRRIAVRVSRSIPVERKAPLSRFLLLCSLLVAHVFNHMSEVTQHVGNISKLSEFLSKAKNGRIGHVRHRNRRTLA